jgi:hypothetical protein
MKQGVFFWTPRRWYSGSTHINKKGLNQLPTEISPYRFIGYKFLCLESEMIINEKTLPFQRKKGYQINFAHRRKPELLNRKYKNAPLAERQFLPTLIFSKSTHLNMWTLVL